MDVKEEPMECLSKELQRSDLRDLQPLSELLKPHIQSFDYFIDKWLDIMLANIDPVVVYDPSAGQKLRNILFFYFRIHIILKFYFILRISSEILILGF
ncbi:hypothetical protein QQ045_024792 [Rhodiola kirilowii]